MVLVHPFDNDHNPLLAIGIFPLRKLIVNLSLSSDSRDNIQHVTAVDTVTGIVITRAVVDLGFQP